MNSFNIGEKEFRATTLSLLGSHIIFTRSCVTLYSRRRLYPRLRLSLSLSLSPPLSISLAFSRKNEVPKGSSTWCKGCPSRLPGEDGGLGKGLLVTRGGAPGILDKFVSRQVVRWKLRSLSLGDDDSLRTRGRETGYPCQGFSPCHP